MTNADLSNRTENKPEYALATRFGRHLSLLRVATEASVAMKCSELHKRRPHPRVEIRHPRIGGRKLGVLLLGQGELLRQPFPDVFQKDLLDCIFEKSPSLNSEARFTIEDIAVSTGQNTGEKFLLLKPISEDAEKIQQEIQLIREGIQEVAGSAYPLDWRVKDGDMTLAYAPKLVDNFVMEQTAELAARILPEVIMLQPVHYPGKLPTSS